MRMLSTAGKLALDLMDHLTITVAFDGSASVGRIHADNFYTNDKFNRLWLRDPLSLPAPGDTVDILVKDGFVNPYGWLWVRVVVKGVEEANEPEVSTNPCQELPLHKTIRMTHASPRLMGTARGLGGIRGIRSLEFFNTNGVKVKGMVTAYSVKVTNPINWAIDYRIAPHTILPSSEYGHYQYAEPLTESEKPKEWLLECWRLTVERDAAMVLQAPPELQKHLSEPAYRVATSGMMD